MLSVGLGRQQQPLQMGSPELIPLILRVNPSEVEELQQQLAFARQRNVNLISQVDVCMSKMREQTAVALEQERAKAAEHTAFVKQQLADLEAKQTHEIQELEDRLQAVNQRHQTDIQGMQQQLDAEKAQGKADVSALQAQINAKKDDYESFTTTIKQQIQQLHQKRDEEVGRLTGMLQTIQASSAAANQSTEGTIQLLRGQIATNNDLWLQERQTNRELQSHVKVLEERIRIAQFEAEQAKQEARDARPILF